MYEDLTSKIIVYSDINCPFCFVLNEWLEQLGRSAEVVWHGVEHEPGLTVKELASPERQTALESEVEQVHTRAPGVAVRVPPIRPSSRLALGAIARAETLAPDRLGELRMALFRGLWCDGLDLSQPAVLAALLRELSVPELMPEPEDFAAVDRRTQTWRDRQFNRIPVLVSATGTTHLGLGDQRSLSTFLGSALFSQEGEGTCQA